MAAQCIPKPKKAANHDVIDRPQNGSGSIESNSIEKKARAARVVSRKRGKRAADSACVGFWLSKTLRRLNVFAARVAAGG